MAGPGFRIRLLDQDLGTLEAQVRHPMAEDEYAGEYDTWGADPMLEYTNAFKDGFGFAINFFAELGLIVGVETERSEDARSHMDVDLYDDLDDADAEDGPPATSE